MAPRSPRVLPDNGRADVDEHDRLIRIEIATSQLVTDVGAMRAEHKEAVARIETIERQNITRDNILKQIVATQAEMDREGLDGTERKWVRDGIRTDEETHDTALDSLRSRPMLWASWAVAMLEAAALLYQLLHGGL